MPFRCPNSSTALGCLHLMYPYLSIAQWLSNISEADAGRPPLSNTGNTVRIVENWEAPKDPEASSRTIHVYTNAPLGEKAFVSASCLSGCSTRTLLLSLLHTSCAVIGCGSTVSLELNGVAVGQPQPGGSFGKGLPTFEVKFAPGKLTAKALASDGSTVLATHSVSSWGAAAAINLTMDVPSISTGTGTAVVRDYICDHKFSDLLLCAALILLNGCAACSTWMGWT